MNKYPAGSKYASYELVCLDGLYLSFPFIPRGRHKYCVGPDVQRNGKLRVITESVIILEHILYVTIDLFTSKIFC